MKKVRKDFSTTQWIKSSSGSQYGYKVLIENTFDSISDLMNFIDTSPRNPFSRKDSTEQSNSRTQFTGTKTYEEALGLLRNGWEEGSKMIKKGLKEKISDSQAANTNRQRSVYDVIGGNASVPRYLQGVPTNMIRQVRTPVKQPVIDVYVDICFSCGVSQKTIINSCIEVLQKVVNIENAGTRVNLYAYRISNKNDYVVLNKVCLKRSSERLNISKLAFPAAHPSMLRRIMLMLDEHLEELPSEWYYGYGTPIKGEQALNQLEDMLK